MSVVIDVRISVGELIDKITILEIKVFRFTRSDQRANAAAELASLQAVAARHGFESDARSAELKKNLKAINETLWVIEEQIRRCEQAGQFGSKFIELARSGYRSNDERSRIKRQINLASDSALIEEKSY
jgi:Family of unknown function (DUF6165)